MAESFGDSLPSARTGPHPGIEFRIRRAPKEGTMPGIRSTLWLIALPLAVICAPARAQTASTGPEQAYPAKPVRLLVGFTPGGGVDINARLLASKLFELLGQQVVVENRPGAGTNIANEYVARSAPDGYTLLFNSPAVAINMSLYRSPPYDALRDFAGVSVFSESTNLLVVPASLAAKSLQELVARARARPGALNYSSAGAGATQLLAGDVQLSFINPVAVGQHVKTGRLRVLAVAGARRTALMPEVPTMKEAGVDGVEVPLWFGMLAQASTPRGIVR